MAPGKQAITSPTAAPAIGPYSPARPGRQSPVPLGTDPARSGHRPAGRRATSAPRRRASSTICGELAAKAGGRRLSSARRAHDDLPRRPRRLRGRQRDLRDVLLSQPYPARATVQVARLPARRPRRNRRDRSPVATVSPPRQARDCRSGASWHVGRSPRQRRRPLHPQHAFDPPDRLDHLFQVLHVLDLDSHVDARVLVLGARRGFEVMMLVLMFAIRELSSAIIPLRSSTCIVSRTV